MQASCPQLCQRISMEVCCASPAFPFVVLLRTCRYIFVFFLLYFFYSNSLPFVAHPCYRSSPPSRPSSICPPSAKSARPMYGEHGSLPCSVRPQISFYRASLGEGTDALRFSSSRFIYFSASLSVQSLVLAYRSHKAEMTGRIFSLYVFVSPAFLPHVPCVPYVFPPYLFLFSRLLFTLDSFTPAFRFRGDIHGVCNNSISLKAHSYLSLVFFHTLLLYPPDIFLSS
jgi:hypothetical protein